MPDSQNTPMPSGYGKLLVTAAVIVFFDQVTKALVMAKIGLFEVVKVIPGFFNLTHIYNTGGAFGFLSGNSTTIRIAVFMVLSIVAAGFVIYLYRRTPRQYSILAFGFALIFGGAVGNLIDRVRMGKVVDFLDFYIGSLHWPSFNVADSAVTVGVSIFLIHMVLGKLPDMEAE